MLTRSEIALKWMLYVFVGAIGLLVQCSILQRITLWGVIPFLYPALAVIPATYENAAPGAVYALCGGAFCDLLLPCGQIPCLYTLCFPAAALLASFLSQKLLPAGFFCSLTVTVLAFLLLDGFRCILLWGGGADVWSTGASVLLRETCMTLPMILPFHILYRFVYARTHVYD